MKLFFLSWFDKIYLTVRMAVEIDQFIYMGTIYWANIIIILELAKIIKDELVE